MERPTRKTLVRCCKTRKGMMEYIASVKSRENGIDIRLETHHATKEGAETACEFYRTADLERFLCGVSAHDDSSDSKDNNSESEG